MSLQDHKQTSQRILSMWSSDSADRPEDLVAEGYVNHQEPYVEGGCKALDLAGYKELVRHYRAAFSDSHVSISMQAAEGDLVATHWEVTATHTGEFAGSPATQKTVTWTGIQIDRYEDGKAVESWVDWDRYGFLSGLGVLSP